MGKIAISSNQRTRSRFIRSGGVGTPPTPPPVSDYQTLITAQSATSFWDMIAGVAAAGTEPDLIGSRDMTMTTGSSTTGTGPFANDGAAVMVEADNERFQTSATHTVNGDWSVSFWIKMITNAGANVVMCALSDTSGFDYCYIIHRDDRSGITLQLSNGAGAQFLDFGTGDRNIENDGLWHHIAVTRDYNATDSLDIICCYLDGARVVNTTRAATPWVLSAAGQLSIGDRYFNSAIPCAGSYSHTAFAAGVVWTPAQVLAQWDCSWLPNRLHTDLMAWYDFTDASTLTIPTADIEGISDKSVNARNLTAPGGVGPAVVSADINGLQVAGFNGTNEALTLGSAFMFANTTAEVWVVYKSDESGTGTIISEGATSLVNAIYRLLDIETTDDFQFQDENNSGVTAINVSVNRNTGVYDLGIAVDHGSLAGVSAEISDLAVGTQGAYTRQTDSFNRFAIGRSEKPTPGTYYDGNIAEIIITKPLAVAKKVLMAAYLNDKYARTWSPIASRHYEQALALGATVYYEMDELTGNVLNKGSAGATHDMTMSGTPARRRRVTPSGLAVMDLDGTDDVGSATAYDIQGDIAFSLFATIYVDAAADSLIIGRWGATSPDQQYILGNRSDGGFEAFIHNSGGYSGLSYTTSITGGWHHVCFTRAVGGASALYLDGTSVVTGTVNAPEAKSGTMQLANKNGTEFNGAIRGAGIVLSSLSAGNVLALAEAGLGIV